MKKNKPDKLVDLLQKFYELQRKNTELYRIYPKIKPGETSLIIQVYDDIQEFVTELELETAEETAVIISACLKIIENNRAEMAKIKRKAARHVQYGDIFGAVEAAVDEPIMENGPENE